MSIPTHFQNHKLNNSALFDQTGRLIRLLVFLAMLSSLLGIPPLRAKAASSITFAGEELLVRPEATSIMVNVVPSEDISLYYEYGTSPGEYSNQTTTASAIANEPCNVVISGLSPDTQYYYRMQYQKPQDVWVVRGEHTFHTQRARGDTFTFAMTADSHMSGGLGNVSLYQQTLANVATENLDFYFDLGDSVWTDGVTTSAGENQRYLAQRQWMGVISHSAPIFIIQGNHENEEGWNLDDTPSKALLSINARKRYYPNPIPDSFYSGNTDTSLSGVDGDHLRGDYFAWEWGDALFVVIDPYEYTLTKPFAGTAGGEDNDETVIGDRWSWTLGLQQFNWFKQTLESSNAKYKFVFAHHLLGGTEDYVRGGAGPANMFEWGGYNIDGTTWGFDTKRPGWGGIPIHQLMVANGVSAFFYGHDHEYAYQKRDGVVYQLVPSPSMSGYGFGIYNEGVAYALRVLPNAGHLRITVSPDEATVDYVRAYLPGGGTNGEVSYSYNIAPNTPKNIRDDYDGDGKTDAVKFVSSSSTAWWYKSSTSAWDGKWLGTENMNYVGASDFDGDGKTDLAKFIPSTGAVWYYLSNTSAWDGKWLGPEAFTYVAGSDFDGDGKTDPAKFVPSTGAVWYLQSSTGTWDGKWLGPEAMNYVGGSDFDGDGKTDPAKFVPSTKVLWYLGSQTGIWTGVYMGSETFSYIPASDFDGDGKTDPAKFITSTGVLWYLSSLTSSWVGVSLGTGTYTYVPDCDFNGDGKTEPAKYDESTHLLSWYNGSTWNNIDMGTDTFTIGNGQ